ncbi:MAG TPA: ATP-binding protein [Chloroflexota bacterium]|jgi:signal transduction histidine kinase
MSAGNAPRVLVVEHDVGVAEELFWVLSRQGYETVVAAEADEALRLLNVGSYDCVLVSAGDDATARPVLDELRRYPPETVAFILIGSGEDISAVDALREGAFDYLTSASATDELKATVARAIERASLGRAMRELVEDFDSSNARLRAFAGELQRRLDRMTAQLRRKVGELDEANRKLADERRKREDFIAMVVHDLAAPLTTIDGYVKLLAKPDLPAQLEDRARSAVGSETKRMARLLHDLTDHLPSTNNHFDVRAASCDLAEVVHQQVALARLRTERHEISLESPPSLLVVGDADRLAQVVGNLLGNAIKHTLQGTIAVRVWCAGTAGRVDIQDQGPGIPPHLLETIFGPRVRVERDGLAPTGSGLGLYIARGIVDALDGRLWAESDGHNGACFHVTLPRPN